MIKKIIYAFVSFTALCLILSIVLEPSEPNVSQETITRCLMTTGTDEAYKKCVDHAAGAPRRIPAQTRSTRASGCG